MLPKRVSATVAEHDAIIRCIRAGDADGARLAVETNYGHGTSQLTTAMTPPAKTHREPGVSARGRVGAPRQR
jgi:DNA-binding GntR family transcriptional regulator